MRATIGFILFLAFGLATPAQAMEVKPTKKVLDNGAKVIVLEVPSSEVVSVQVWYHVGSKNEEIGQRGLAHMFEHLMFKGTRRIGPEEHARRINEVGGTVNAFTTEDVTAYHQTLPKEKLELAIKLEADRMHNLLLTEATLDSERQVVLEEKRLRVDNNPVGAMIQALWANAFQKHHYQWTAIGTEEDLNGATLDDLKAFYEKWYIPNNATIVITGGVKTDEAMALVTEHFGKIPKGAEPDRSVPEEPKQSKRRDIEVKRSAQLPVMLGGYKMPSVSDPDMPALEILGQILSAGDSSRMQQELVEKKKLAVGAGGFTWKKEDPSLFAIYAFYLPNVDSAALEKALEGEIDRVKKGGVTKHELQKAKNQLSAGYIFDLETADGLANAIGNAEVVEGDVQRFVDGTKRYEAVTAEDVQRVAKKYLNETSLTFLNLIPQAAGGNP